MNEYFISLAIILSLLTAALGIVYLGTKGILSKISFGQWVIIIGITSIIFFALGMFL